MFFQLKTGALLAAVLLLPLYGCSPNETGRWYTAAQVGQGTTLFNTHCVACHGENAAGSGEWMRVGEDGNYPPPPLDGSAHAWHHSHDDLKNVISAGGARYGGAMPAFGEVLTEEEILAVIAYFQSTWDDEIYERWRDDRNK